MVSLLQDPISDRRGLLRDGEALAEALGEGLHAAVGRPRHQQTVLPARQAQLQSVPAPHLRQGIGQVAGGLQGGASLLPQALGQPFQLRQGGSLQGQGRRAVLEGALLGPPDAIGREHPGQGMEQHPAHAQP